MAWFDENALSFSVIASEAGEVGIFSFHHSVSR
jgi:hypothetical protein